MFRSGRIRARNDAASWRLFSSSSAVLFCLVMPSVLAFLQTIKYTCTSNLRQTTARSWQRENLWMSSSGGDEDQAMEAIQSFAVYHQGKWRGRAKSFSVTPDIAAGIVQRKVLDEYNVVVKLTIAENQQFALSETISWDDNNNMAFRSMPLQDTDFDIDTVDASYSFDTVQSDFPSSISGTEKPCLLLIEHCIATGEDRRARCFALYGEDESLVRIVISDEERVKSDNGESTNGTTRDGAVFTAKDLMEMQNDVDRLVDRIVSEMNQGNNGSVSNSSSDLPSVRSRDDEEMFMSRLGQIGKSVASPDGAQNLLPHDISLLELSSGVWLGDAIIRDSPGVAGSPVERGRGFSSSVGSASDKNSWKSKAARRLGSWSVGVQKIAWRWMWNFGEEIRQVIDVGKALGTPLEAPVIKSVAGSVCVDESLSRRIAKDERMVYIDWPQNDSVGFLSGPFLVQLPRYINFDPSAASASRTLNKPFMTEFCIFQKSQTVNEANGKGIQASHSDPMMSLDTNIADLPEIVCSKMNRLYNFEGRLKQGFSSFYTLKRFGTEDETIGK